MNKWYLASGPHGDVVLSTRIRLARNLRGIPFPCRLDAEGRRKVNESVRRALAENEAVRGEKIRYLEMAALSDAQAVSLAEHHLISPEFADSRAGRGLLLSEEEEISVMLCEEDHVRLQVMRAGLDLEGAYAQADRIDTQLDRSLHFAFDERLGFLTQCPTNLGTAMRASVMLHLPALARCGQISRLAATVSKLGLTIRGAYGEGSKPQGDFYQMSNQVTLGISEQAALDNLGAITMQVIAQERTARETLCREDTAGEATADTVWRAYGLLRSARLLAGAEFMELISLVRFGASMKLLPVDLDTVSELIAQMQPATINARQEQPLDGHARDRIRAEEVRTRLGAM